MLRLLRLKDRKPTDMPFFWGRLKLRRVSPSGDSILMMSAPRSPSNIVQNGPEITELKSRMRKPANGPSVISSEFLPALWMRQQNYHGLDPGASIRRDISPVAPDQGLGTS